MFGVLKMIFKQEKPPTEVKEDFSQPEFIEQDII